MSDLFRCAKCKKVSFLISRADAQKESDEYQRYYDGAPESHRKFMTVPTGIKAYEGCPYCGDTYKNFTPLSSEDQLKFPQGVTVNPIMNPDE